MENTGPAAAAEAEAVVFDSATTLDRKCILLIHGSCHGAWCWRDLTPCLEALGLVVVSIDLPSHGEDRTPIHLVTLELYATCIVDKIRELGRPVILVGHSAAGFAISRAVELFPEGVEKLVFLAAYTPQNGDTQAQLRLLMPELTNHFLHSILPSPDGQSFVVDLSQVAEIFYNGCSQEQIEYAQAHLCPQATLPQQTPIELSADRFGRVSKSFILCDDDHSIPTAKQEWMVRDWPVGSVFRLASGHSPFFSCPHELATLLFRIALSS